ncbi:MAG: DsbA family protein [Gemmatimonadota bacterium]
MRSRQRLELHPVPNFQQIVAAGLRIGAPLAPVTVVEFTDLECPFCARFHEVYRSLVVQHGANLSLVFVHFPLPSHRFAKPAAQAAECAAEAGRFAQFVDLVFQKQDSLGLLSFTSMAARPAWLTRFLSTDASRIVTVMIESPLALHSGKRSACEAHLRSSPTVGALAFPHREISSIAL